ncbi:MAG: hypothetical protein ACKV19_27995 [Verrucomicrobiales bacterium]
MNHPLLKFPDFVRLSMTTFFSKYGKIALAWAAIFLSGQVIGWVMAWHSCDARQAVAADTERWSAQMMARLQEDLELGDDQVITVKSKLDLTSARLEQKRDAAMFQIHLEILKLHDDLSPGLTESQRKKLAISRQKLIDSMRQKFPELLSGTEVPPEVPEAAESTSP